MINRRDFIKATATGGTLAAFGQLSEAKAMFPPERYELANASGKQNQISVIAEADIVIVGGSSGAVAAASAAACSGKSVFLIAPLPHLGDDICGTFRYDIPKNVPVTHPLARRLFLSHNNPTPLFIKTELENELIWYDIHFLYSCYVTNIFRNDKSQICGVVIANRSGRQAIRCKAVIDCTHTAIVAKVAGADLNPFIPGIYDFSFVSVGNTPSFIPEGIKVEETSYKVSVKNKPIAAIRYTLSTRIDTDDYAVLQEIEQTIRDKTWTPDQSDSSDIVEYLPLRSIVSGQPNMTDTDLVRKIPLECIRPKDINNLWVAGPAGDFSPRIAHKLMFAPNAISWGQIVGEKVADYVSNKPFPSLGNVVQTESKDKYNGQIHEILSPLRKEMLKGYVNCPDTSLPVLGEFDVIITGGGTAGAPAGIAAARNGARTLITEYLHGLGGLMTLGLIGRYWDGHRGGFTEEVNKGVRGMAPPDHPRQLKDWEHAQQSDWKQEYFRREYRKAGGELWFGVLCCGALVENNRVTGIVVVTPYGRGIVKGKIIIDSTGSGDIAIAAGAAYEYTGKHVAVQGAGMGHWAPQDFYNNNDWAFIDDTDILDVSRIYVQAKKKLKGHYDMVKLPQTRERRRVVGEYTVSVYDVINNRRYPDTISYHKSSFDTHGMIVDPYFILCPPEKRHTIYDADVPLRALIPKGLKGILTTGLGASADRDAMPVIRMQSCLQAQGYAVGYLAAVAIKENKPIEKIDIKKIQKYLVSMGNLPERILTDKPSKEFTEKDLNTAMETIPDNYKGLSVLLTSPVKSRQLILSHFKNKGMSKDNINFASILGMLGNDTYASIIADEIDRQATWDKGWDYTGMGQFGPCMSRMDALMIALGNSKNTHYVPVILKKATLLGPENTFSHFRAVCMACESMQDSGASQILYDLLTMPGMRYHYLESYKDARRKTVPNVNDVNTRNAALKELHLARALYICGDKKKLGENILRKYATGLQGHYSRYAISTLESKK